MPRIKANSAEETAKTERKAIPNSIRFEVFKRDSFTCQYCGGKAPEKVLVVDHINPVKHGGTNDILNLITACFECNSGKGAKKLSDKTAIKKQIGQLEELNERRLQLDMLQRWRDGLEDIDKDKLIMFLKEFEKTTGYSINEVFQPNIKKWLKKYAYIDLLDALDSGSQTYLKTNMVDGTYDQQSVNTLLNKIPNILSVRKKYKDDPESLFIHKLCSCVRKKFNKKFIPENVSSTLKRIFVETKDEQVLWDIYNGSYSYTRFIENIEEACIRHFNEEISLG